MIWRVGWRRKEGDLRPVRTTAHALSPVEPLGPVSDVVVHAELQRMWTQSDRLNFSLALVTDLTISCQIKRFLLLVSL